MKRNLLLFLVGALAVPLSAQAGYKSSNPVVIVTNADGTLQVSGALRSAYSSADATQYIQVRLSGGGYDYVVARDATGKVAMCVTTDPMNIQVLASVGPASLVNVSIANGTCTSVNVTTSSQWMSP